MLAHWICSSYITNDVFYYVFDAIVLSCIAESMRHLRPLTSLNVFMQKVCITGICLNFIGLMLWFNYESPTLYNNLYTMLYAMVLYAMLNRGMDEPVCFRNTIGFSRDRLNSGESCNSNIGNNT